MEWYCVVLFWNYISQLREGAQALKFCVIIEEKKTPMRLESNQVNKHSWLVFRQLQDREREREIQRVGINSLEAV